MSPKFEKLFQPLSVGQMQLKNRIVMLPVTTNYTVNGRVTRRQIDFYEERARGGAGLICFGFMPPISIEGTHATGTFAHSDELIPDLRQLTSSIHARGAKVLAQLCIRYEWKRSQDAPMERVAPSPGIVTGPGFKAGRELSVEEIEQITDQFAEAARRCREAGFDMVEFHCGLGYLINRFISSATNKRSDRYGGSLENRLTFLLEILSLSRKKAGEDYTFGCRISAEEFIEGGHGIEESQRVARILEKAGVHWLNVQAGWLECSQPLIQSSVPQGAYVYLAESIKQVVNIPVVAGLRISDPLLSEQILAQNRADLIGMCRALLADPELPQKAREGRLDDIRRCIACCECLDSQYVRGEAMGCSVNPWIGREREGKFGPAIRPKRVFVVGGGPAGMQAAIVARQRGHQVTLFEKGDGLGGQLVPGSVPPYKVELAALTQYLAEQVRKSGVEIKTGIVVDAEFIGRGNPDAVIVSTGAVPFVPDLPGIDGNNVVDPIDVLRGKALMGRRALVVGGGLIGCETAEFLATRGKEVTITTRQDKVGNDIGPSTRWVIRKRLQKAGVTMRPRLTAVEITPAGVWFEHEGRRELIEADTVVIAAGMRPNDDLAKAIAGKVGQVITVGDCTGVGRIRQAIENGARAGLEL